jgi:hypothetical protein
MAPIASSTMTETVAQPQRLKLNLRSSSPESACEPGRNLLPGPLKYTGSLDHYPHFQVTPSIGCEFGKELQLSELLDAPNSDELIQDLAVLSKSTPVQSMSR